MRNMQWLFLFLMISLLGLGLAAACGGGDDDDDDDAAEDDDDATDDDDAADDDDDAADDDDDDATGNVEVTNLEVGECVENEPDPTDMPLNIVEAEWVDGVLTVYRVNARINCSPDITVTGNLESGVLTLVENDAGIADCNCAADVFYDVEGIPESDAITVVIQYNIEKGWNDIAEFVIETSGDDYEWVLPNVELIGHDDTYPADQDMEIRVNACKIEDASQIGVDPYKIQVYGGMIDGVASVYTLDRRNLTSPGQIEDLCNMIDATLPGMAAGTYPLVAPGYLDDYFVWVDGGDGLVIE